MFETFRGVSHLLMEKVTRDLKRTAFSPASRPKAEAAAEEPAAPAAPAARAAEPAAKRPMLETPQANPARPRPPALPADFGNEVALPGLGEAVAELESEPVQLQKPETRNVAPAAKRPAPVAAEIAMARPKPQPQPQPEARRAAPAPELTAERPGLRQATVEVSGGGGATEAVIPITIPRGTTREIIVRIVISEE